MIDYDKKYSGAQSAKTGASIIITVNISGIPTPEVTWTRDGTALKTADNVTIETSDTFSTLTIKGCVKSDTTKYQVTATNEVGDANAEFDVTVNGMYIINVFVLSLQLSSYCSCHAHIVHHSVMEIFISFLLKSLHFIHFIFANNLE